MSRTGALFNLQQADIEIDNRVNAVNQIQGVLSDLSQVEQARHKAHEAEIAYVAARSKLHELENSADDSARHATEVEKKLYGGQMKGPKEMSAAQHEIDTFRQRRKDLDDQTEEAMIAEEAAGAAFKAAKTRLIEIEADWGKSAVALKEEKLRLEGELTGLRSEREKRSKAVMPPDLPLYERLRGQKQGIAVAELQNGKICGRCRVELPLAKQRDVKSGLTIVNCPSCGRILYFR